MTRILLAVCAGLLLAAPAAGSVGDGWRWPRTNLNKPVKVRVVVDAQFDRGLFPELRDAAKMWQSPDLRLDVAAKPVPSCDPIMAGTICVSSPKPGEGPCPDMGGCSWQTEALAEREVNPQKAPASEEEPGRPSVALSGSARPAGGATSRSASALRLISYARVWINTRYTWAGKDWTRRVFCHELGHDIGLGHTEDGTAPYQPSCMANNYTYYATKPSADDLAFLHSLYSTVTP